MKRLVSIVGAAAFVWIVSGQSASATPITYNWDAGTSFKLNDGATADLTGSFTINLPTSDLTGSDIVITGGTHGEAGTYAPSFNDHGTDLAFLLGANLLQLFVSPNLDIVPQDMKVLEVTVSGATSTSISGGAQIASAAVPEPASLALFVPALLGLGLFWRRRQGTPRAT